MKTEFYPSIANLSISYLNEIISAVPRVLLRDGFSVSTLTEGGNGVNSLEGAMPELPPERYEAGTLPTPAIAGLLAGMGEISRLGVDSIHRHECALVEYAKERLTSVGGIRIYVPEASGSVLLFNADGHPADEIGEKLDRAGICVRTGYHCAAMAHKTLGTPAGGAVRIGFGIYNTFADVDALADALKKAIN